jgi:hypothetical protein
MIRIALTKREQWLDVGLGVVESLELFPGPTQQRSAVKFATQVTSRQCLVIRGRHGVMFIYICTDVSERHAASVFSRRDGVRNNLPKYSHQRLKGIKI